MSVIVPVVPRPAVLAVICAAALPCVSGPAWSQGLGQPAASPIAMPAGSGGATPPVLLEVPPQRSRGGTGTGGTDTDQDGALKLLSDEADFCAKLGAQVGDMSRDTKMPAEAADLAREGKRLCADGKIRSGIMHLRRAYVMLRQTEMGAGGGTKP